MIHDTAIVDASAQLSGDIQIGAYSVIGADVEIGSGCRISHHVQIEGPTQIGANNRIYSFVSIGTDPQDKKFHGESNSRLEIGDGNTIREFVTINRGTEEAEGLTHIGHNNWLMAYVHIAHDCRVGDHTVFANNATLAGHVEISDWVILGGFVGVHQFCKVGEHAFAAMYSAINRDVPPFCYVSGQFARPRGINAEGLKRRGFDTPRIVIIKRAYRTLYMAGLSRAEARERIAQQAESHPDVAAFLAFIDASERSLVR